MIGVVRGVSKDQREELGFRVGCTQHKIPAQPQPYPGSTLRTLGLSEPLSPTLSKRANTNLEGCCEGLTRSTV